ncbi:MAG: Gfo/Idh/MocA family oxidoreductase [Alkalibacterium sp.]|nr:Gfo/Idh/MocA family oxidoreductase [Alkalibacterium sp.]
MVFFHTESENTEGFRKKYGVPKDRQFTDWQELLDRVDMVFVHTPTDTHEDVCRAFLKKRIPTFVDKPLTEHVESTKALLDFAAGQETLLMTGFNRRFAPMVQSMKQLPDKNHLILQKNQVDSTDFDVRYRIYDMMIHPLDTALYLLGEPAEVTASRVVKEANRFSRAWVLLETSKATAYVSVNNESGTKLEKYEVQGKSETVILENLTDKTSYKGNESISTQAGDWVTTLEKGALYR